jgi:hypothetical protein
MRLAPRVSWRVFKNPLSLFIGGVTAVIMELAEPRVRTGIWEHTTFRVDPIRRLRRTGLAAMVTVYGARSTAEPMIARIRPMHEMVAGTTRVVFGGDGRPPGQAGGPSAQQARKLETRALFAGSQGRTVAPAGGTTCAPRSVRLDLGRLLINSIRISAFGKPDIGPTSPNDGVWTRNGHLQQRRRRHRG